MGNVNKQLVENFPITPTGDFEPVVLAIKDAVEEQLVDKDVFVLDKKTRRWQPAKVVLTDDSLSVLFQTYAVENNIAHGQQEGNLKYAKWSIKERQQDYNFQKRDDVASPQRSP